MLFRSGLLPSQYFRRHWSEDADAGLEEIQGKWTELPASHVRQGVVHVFAPELADAGRFAERMIPRDPVVLIAAGLEEEKALLRAGFGQGNGLILNLKSFGSVQDAVEAARGLFPGYSLRYYPAEARGKMRLWLAELLGQYQIVGVGLEEAMAIIESLSATAAAA